MHAGRPRFSWPAYRETAGKGHSRRVPLPGKNAGPVKAPGIEGTFDRGGCPAGQIYCVLFHIIQAARGKWRHKRRA